MLDPAGVVTTVTGQGLLALSHLMFFLRGTDGTIYNLDACESIGVEDTAVKIYTRHDEFGYPIADFTNHAQACQALDRIFDAITCGQRGYSFV